MCLTLSKLRTYCCSTTLLTLVHAQTIYSTRPVSSAVVDAQVVEFPDVEGPLEFGYDEEWLGILQATHHLMSLNRQQAPLPGKST